MSGIDTSVEAQTSAPRQHVFSVLSDPSNWVDWVGPVIAVEPTHPNGAQPTWLVEAGIKIGPFKKSTLIRLQLVECVDGDKAQFRRIAVNAPSDGAIVNDSESPATVQPEPTALEFSVELSDTGDGTVRVVSRLRFDGSFPPGVEAIIKSEMRRTIERLSVEFN